MSQHITIEEELGYFQQMYDEMKKATPSSPVWYQIVDICLGTLMAHKLEELKMRAAERAQENAG